MARSRDWGRLSEGYRKRLEKAGVSRADYERGAPLSKARGHAQTPEHPSEVSRNLYKYSRYIQRKAVRKPRRAPSAPSSLSAPGRWRLYRKAQQMLGDLEYYDDRTVFDNIMYNMSEAEVAISSKMSRGDWQRAAAPQPALNPWWYH